MKEVQGGCNFKLFMALAHGCIGFFAMFLIE
jgi:hypothetical protein